MKDMYKYINPGIIHFMAYPETMKGEGPVLETLNKIAVDDYFHVVEITSIKDREVRKKAGRLLKDAHMDVYYGAQPVQLSNGLNINSFDDEHRKKAVEILKSKVDEAVETGCKGFAFLSGKNVDIDKTDEALDLLTDSVREICTYAASVDKDLTVCLEVFDYDIDKCALIGPVDVVERFAKRMCAMCSNFGLIVDLSHLPLLRENAYESIAPIKEYIRHIHIGNAVTDKNHPAYGDSHPSFGLEGSDNDVEELVVFLKVLLETGYLNASSPKAVSFEIKPLADQSSEVIIANAKRVLTKAWARL